MENIEIFVKYILNLFDISYEVIRRENEIYFLKHRDFSDFWIVTACEDFDLDKQYEIKNLFKNVYVEYIEADKNISLLIIWQAETIDEKIKRQIVEIEKDPYYFKKYVIVTSPTDINNMLNEFGEDDYCKTIMDPKTFKKLKGESPVTGTIGPIHLLYSIAHKLPFLMMDAKQSELNLSHNLNISSQEDKDTLKWALITEISEIKASIVKNLDQTPNSHD